MSVSLLIIFSGANPVCAQQENRFFVKVTCPYGSFIIKLYNETPVHRDNILKLVRAKYFDSTTFHRIIKNFVVQGGDPDSLYAVAKALRPEQKWLKPELNDSLYHKKGAVAMGRDDNTAQQSFSTQFYLVEGKAWTDAQLDSIQQKFGKGRILPEYQRLIYKKTGGLPYLDHRYTIFGEIVKGQEVADKLSAVPVDGSDSPLEKMWMKMEVLDH